MDHEELKHKRIGVLLGGLSAEREVSLETGTAVEQALRGVEEDAGILGRIAARRMVRDHDRDPDRREDRHGHERCDERPHRDILPRRTHCDRRSPAAFQVPAASSRMGLAIGDDRAVPVAPEDRGGQIRGDRPLQEPPEGRTLTGSADEHDDLARGEDRRRPQGDRPVADRALDDLVLYSLAPADLNVLLRASADRAWLKEQASLYVQRPVAAAHGDVPPTGSTTSPPIGNGCGRNSNAFV